MGWETEIIKALQRISNFFTDTVFLGITMLGEEITFFAVMVVIFWCYNKKFGLMMGLNFLFAALCVNIMKNTIKRPRPFASNPSLSIGDQTEGFSFPSGHTQSASSMGTMLSLRFGKKRPWLIAVFAVLIFLVGFSRIYLGQHYISDVLIGLLIGVSISFAVYYFFMLMGDKEEYWALLIIPIAIILMIIFHKEESHRDFYVAGGVSIAIAIGYFLEKRFINYDVSQELWWVQIIKVVIAGAIAFALKDGLKALFAMWNVNLFFGTFIRYFLLGIWGSFGAMAIFKYGLGAIKKKFPSWAKKAKENI